MPDVIHLRVPDPTLIPLQQYAEKHRLKLPAAIRKLVDIGLDAERHRQTFEDITGGQKNLTYLLCEILVINRMLVDGRKPDGQINIQTLASQMFQSLSKPR